MAKWDKNTFIQKAKDSCYPHISNILIDLVNFADDSADNIAWGRGKDCGTWDGSGKFQWITLDADAANNGSFEEDLWHSWKSQDQTVTICFQAVLKVLNNPNNKEVHKPALKKLIINFENKWNDLLGPGVADFYINLLNKKYKNAI